MPKGWSIELSGIPEIFQDCLDIVLELGEANVVRWESEAQFELFKSLVKQAADISQTHGVTNN